MSTTNNTDVPAFRSMLAPRSVWVVGALAGIAAAVLTEVFALGARALGVSMNAGAPGSGPATPIPVGAFAASTLISAAAGTVLAVVLVRAVRRPARTFVVTAGALTVLSLLSPALAADTSTSTKLVLGLSHLVAAAVVIPPLAVRLSHHRPAGE